MPSPGKILIVTAMAAGLLQACAATPDVAADEKIAVAKAAVQRAEQAGAPQAAPAELSAARDKLAQAQKANDDHKGAPAAALADQANVDAQVAEAAARANHSHKAAMEFDANLQALREQAAKTTAASDPAQQPSSTQQ
ncbi:MAG: DUF4398 domain-containing protein [Steroidobacteraceae bacterium]